MIEIIREEDLEQAERKELPKDIKQIGKPDIGERIYVENRAYEYLHPYEDRGEKMAYILLGRFENYAGRQCVFVEAAIRLEEMAFEGELPLWNDQTWGYIYRQMKEEYDNMAIVGWAMDIKGQLPNLTMRIEALHQNHFGGTHQVLFLMDSLEMEETFYGSRGGHLYRREGFYIYYNKSIPTPVTAPQEEQSEVKIEDFGNTQAAVPEKEKPRQGSYRRQLLEKEEKPQAPAYASSFFLLVIACAIGFTAYINYQKMNSMEQTLAQMSDTTRTEAQTETAVIVEPVAGNVTAEPSGGLDKSTETSQEVSTQTGQLPATGTDTPAVPDTPVMPDTQTETEAPVVSEIPAVPETTPVLTEAQTYLAQGYYVVQKGDSLVGICKKIYQTTAVMDELCEANGIEDENAIYAGQRLTLPN